VIPSATGQEENVAFARNDCLARLRKVGESGRPMIVAGAGTGISAKCAEAGGADLIII
jgi:predicted TIM-barrel enzyme